jgi:hypothetical protein
MAAEVVRRRVEDDVGAQRERLRQVRRGERVVDTTIAAALRAVSAAARMSTMFSSGLVGVSSQTIRVRSSRCSAGPALMSSAETPVEDVAIRLVDLREHPVNAAVDVCHRDDAVARLEQVHQRHRCPEPGREREPVLGALEGGKADLQCRPRGVGDPRVVVALYSPTASCT